MSTSISTRITAILFLFYAIGLFFHFRKRVAESMPAKSTYDFFVFSTQWIIKIHIVQIVLIFLGLRRVFLSWALSVSALGLWVYNIESLTLLLESLYYKFNRNKMKCDATTRRLILLGLVLLMFLLLFIFVKIELEVVDLGLNLSLVGLAGFAVYLGRKWINIVDTLTQMGWRNLVFLRQKIVESLTILLVLLTARFGVSLLFYIDHKQRSPQFELISVAIELFLINAILFKFGQSEEPEMTLPIDS